MSFLSTLLDYVYSFLELVRYKDYTIRKVYLEYVVIKQDDEVTGEFWSKQQQKWDMIPDIFMVNVQYEKFLPLPSCVEHPVLKIVYIFNSREYVYTTSDMNYVWPPKKAAGMSFVLPYKHAVLLNSDDVPVKNITQQFNRYAGPSFNFHGGPIMVEKPFTKVRVTNIMNQQSIINLCS
jgi:hypothetical protein